VLVDAATGAVLFQEDQIHDVNVSGTVNGNSTQGFAADACAAEAPTPMPYATVSIGATSVFTDANGNFTVPNAGASAVSVVSTMAGNYFVVSDQAGVNTTLSQNVTPPGPANFL